MKNTFLDYRHIYQFPLNYYYLFFFRVCEDNISPPECISNFTEEQIRFAMNQIYSLQSNRTLPIKLAQELNLDISSATQLVKYFLQNRTLTPVTFLTTPCGTKTAKIGG